MAKGRALAGLIVVGGFLAGCAGSSLIELHTAKRNGLPIFVSEVGVSKPNRFGAMAASVAFHNTSAQSYKYVDFVVVAFNRVGDVLTRDGDETPEIKLRFTGPLRRGRTPRTMKWPAIWYRTPIACLRIRRIAISHLDGTSSDIEGEQLERVIAKGLQGPCPT